jgi:hypothetical protein
MISVGTGATPLVFGDSATSKPVQSVTLVQVVIPVQAETVV